MYGRSSPAARQQERVSSRAWYVQTPYLYTRRITHTPRHGSPTTSSSLPVANKPYISFRSPRHRHDCMRIFPGFPLHIPGSSIINAPPFNHLIAILIPVTTWLIFTSLLFDVQPISTHVVGCDTIPTPSLGLPLRLSILYHVSSYTGRSQYYCF
jgi:hypothetical protein